MPYPTSYDVTYSYTGFQQAQGDDSFPGTQIDADFAGLQANIESLTTFMGGVMRSDGALQNSVVTFDSLSAELQTAGLTPAASWATATQYAKDTNVIVDFGLYRAAAAHLSNVFATDLAAGRWVLVTNFPAVAYVAGSGLALNTLTFSVTGLTTAHFAANVIDTDVSLTANSDTRIPTQKAVKAYADQLLAANDAMIFKGVIDCSANPNYPAADRGWAYRVSVAGKIGGASGVNVENGDLITCMTDGTAAGTQAAVGAQWAITQTNIDGAVVGPASVTDDLPAIFDGVTGKLIKSKTYAAFKTLLALAKGDVGLGNVDNTSNVTERAAAATLTNKTIAATANTLQIPYFSASLSANQVTTSAAVNKVLFNTELADSNSWYDNATNYRLQPLLAGKYRIHAQVQGSGTTVTEIDVDIYKNGAMYSRTINLSSGAATSTVIDQIISFNGSTDYVEIFASITGTGTLNFLGGAGPIRSWFEAQYMGP